MKNNNVRTQIEKKYLHDETIENKILYHSKPTPGETKESPFP